MFVKDCMTPNPITVAPDEDVKNAFNLLNIHAFRQVPIVKDEQLVGIVTDRDLRVAVTRENHPVVANVMSPKPVTISEDSTIEEAAQIICGHKFNALPVLSKKGKLVGIITVTDILNGLLNLLGFHTNPVRVRVQISEGTDIYNVHKLLKECSDRVVSVSSSEEGYDIFYFWLLGCDFDKLDRKLDEGKLDIDVTYSEGSKFI
jgi:CBS-domain-containing membrane protein